MRTLLILRHAKSSHDEPVSDKERTLTSRGRKDARRMGELARKRNLLPDRVLCSTATRARETLEFFAQGANLEGPVGMRSTSPSLPRFFASSARTQAHPSG